MNTPIIIGGFLALIVVNVWAANVDTERNAAYATYEQCVQQQYHMTPMEWYEENGQYPLCGN